MTTAKRDLVNGKESIAAEAKRLFSELDFTGITKGTFITKMLEEVSASPSDTHSLIKHLEAVWRGKAAPTIAELDRAKKMVQNFNGETKREEPQVSQSLSRMGVYVPKYDKTRELQQKMKASKKS
ncbi:hypothetical protein FHS57_006268 [Runella defluvii]|uniref:Uncharacterized protein n=2 Tax=Runella defluvii TaxID=370973 RepID=A0A7W6EU57_9BACT|nr:hypothetical protein [Runella defluvii]